MAATPMLIAAAREMCRQQAAACNVNEADLWNTYAESFTRDARAMLNKAGVPDLVSALLDAVAGHNDPELFLPQVRAALRKATGRAA